MAFNTQAELSIQLARGETQNIRQQIERDLSDIAIGVSGGPGGRGAVGATGPEPAGLDVSRRQLGETQDLVTLAEERNQFLEELTDDGGGGGSALRTAGTAGLGARALGLGAGVTSVAASPFAALAALTLGTGALAAGTADVGGPSPGPGPPTPQTTGPRDGPGSRFPGIAAGLVADPSGGRETTEPPDGPPRGGPRVESNPQVNIDISGPLEENEIVALVEGRVDDALQGLRRDLESLFTGTSSARTIRDDTLFGPSSRTGL